MAKFFQWVGIIFVGLFLIGLLFKVIGFALHVAFFLLHYALIIGVILIGLHYISNRNRKY